MLKEIENKIEELKEKRQRLRDYVKANESNKNLEDLVNIYKGQVIELLNQIQYLKRLVKLIKGE